MRGLLKIVTKKLRQGNKQKTLKYQKTKIIQKLQFKQPTMGKNHIKKLTDIEDDYQLKKLEKKFTNFKVGEGMAMALLSRRRRRGKICRSCRFIWIFLPSSSSVRSLTSSKGVISLVFCPAKIR